MNFYLLQLIGKWIGFVALSIATSFGYQIDKTTIEVDNQNSNKNVNILAEVVNYQTFKSYDSSIPSNIIKIVTEGQEGIIFRNNSGEVVYSEEAINKQVTQGTGSYGIYKGVMTGYGPDCSTCSGRGYVACKTVDKQKFNLIDNGVYYTDSEYGKSRVIAASLTMFPCGTIIEVQSSTLGKFMAIVLDTGYDMNKNLEKGIYHFDIAYQTEKDEMVSKTTDMSGNTVFSVQRWGW